MDLLAAAKLVVALGCINENPVINKPDFVTLNYTEETEASRKRSDAARLVKEAEHIEKCVKAAADLKSAIKKIEESINER